MEYIREFILNFIEKKAKLPKGVDIDTFNYIDSGYVDSIGIIGFMLEIESEFDIEISAEDMLSLEFRTVGGVVSIISKKLGHNV
jgi:acyl carrier protein